MKNLKLFCHIWYWNWLEKLCTPFEKKNNKLGQQLELFVGIGDRWNDFTSISQTPQEMLKQWVKDAKSHIKISYIKRCVLKIADTSLVQIQ